MELGLKHPMYRSMMDEVVGWEEGSVRKALLLRGERQVGKMTLPLFCAGFMDVMHSPSQLVIPERPKGFEDMPSGHI